jgi:hypothetical protein
MSVLMTMRVSADANKIEHEDHKLLEDITTKAKNFGLISHHFYGSKDEVLVVDEWPDEQSFQRFFEAAPEIGGVMERAGATTQPEFTFWRRLDTGDELG